MALKWDFFTDILENLKTTLFIESLTRDEINKLLAQELFF